MSTEKHGDSLRLKRTPTYHSWVNMNGRCYNKNNPAYHNYGGRGIGVCKRWRESYLSFKLDMGERSKFQSIERINNSKNYSPKNCKWATKREQILNRRKRKNKNGLTYIGVMIAPTRTKRTTRFVAKITNKAKRYHVGVFNTEKEAAIARDKFIIKNNLDNQLNILEKPEAKNA